MKKTVLQDGNFNTKYEPLIYLAPFLFGVILWVLYPFINVILISFKENYNQLTDNFNGIGFQNYIDVITHRSFLNALRNTALYVITVVPISTILSIIFANLLNQKIKGIALFQTAFFLPLVTSATAIGLVFKLMFNTNFGAINQILMMFNISPIHWLDNPAYNIYTLVVFGVWNIMPFTIILLLSGLQNINPMYYTVAKVDGASNLKMFFRITIPLLAPTIGIVLIINTISCSKVYSQLFPLFTGRPGIADNLYTVVYYIYQQFYEKWELGKAASASVILFIILFLLTMLQLRMQKKWKHY
ncbi:MAG: sugar ABC transporter permease [Erysipelotrichaceae bacterium]|nr:sugar ABC transporter permease [Erysipelotrichaceae bacterium]